jgi:hypothetical protein
VTTGPKLPVAAAFTEQKKIDQETARRVTQDALAVGNPRWMLGDGEFDMLAWHDYCLQDNTVPIAPYNKRNATDPYDIEYRVEQRIKEYSDTVRLWQKQLDETYEQRSQVEQTIGACKDCGLETPGVRGRVRVKSHVFLSLCLRLVLAIANYERGNNPGKTTLELQSHRLNKRQCQHGPFCSLVSRGGKITFVNLVICYRVVWEYFCGTLRWDVRAISSRIIRTATESYDRFSRFVLTAMCQQSLS